MYFLISFIARHRHLFGAKSYMTKILTTNYEDIRPYTRPNTSLIILVLKVKGIDIRNSLGVYLEY